ncbi:uncharacterized protein LOC131613234 [Vicia villosa]|uniref:uncharacterized protein LOC131613234 n=1 Tax=Vicia villosa TaxID=3911 RepID=UPI00273CB304|nr:uncharacterized protein LOC131613234 [Vicia villosa]
MLMDPLPNICKVYSLLVQQERQNGTPVDESKVLAIPNTNRESQSRNSSRGRGNFRRGRTNSGRGRGNRVCTHCGMTNHTIDTCFKNHGYPPNWKLDGTINNYITSHDKPDVIPNDDSEANAPVNSGLTFTPEQHKALLALLQDASNLQSHRINHLTSQTKLSSDVLYMPDFAFNLISVPKLTKSLNCQLMFTDTTCVIHDLSSRKMIGTTELHGGLYLLKTPSVSLYPNPHSHFVNSNVQILVNKSSNCSLWHIRLGHTSHVKPVELNKVFPFIKHVNPNLPCDVKYLNPIGQSFHDGV